MAKRAERFEVYAGEFAAEPCGGMRDFHRSYADLPAAVAYAEGYLTGKSGGWASIWDAHEGREVWTDAQADYGVG